MNGAYHAVCASLGLFEPLGHLDDLDAEIGFLALDLCFSRRKQKYS
jgi:hypothetical protein